MLRVRDQRTHIALRRKTIIHGLPVLAAIPTALYPLPDRSSIQELIEFAVVSALHPDSSSCLVAEPQRAATLYRMSGILGRIGSVVNTKCA